MQASEAPKIIADEYSAKILVSSFLTPRTAIEMSRMYSIPIAACYRRIKMLEEYGLLRCVERRLTAGGKRISVYQSILKGATIYMENGVLKTRLELVDNLSEDYSVNWDTAMKV